MSDRRDLRLSYRFVPPGTRAPIPLPPSEIWIDVGDRTEGAVLDHHQGGAGSATLLALDHADLLLRHAGGRRDVVLVLHQAPDLDAVAAAWIVRKTLLAGHPLLATSGLSALAEAVTDHDQGTMRNESLEHDLPLIMSLLIRVNAGEGSDRETLANMMDHLDVVGEVLGAGGSLSDAARAIRSPAVDQALATAAELYKADVERGRRVDTWLPTRGRDERSVSVGDGPMHPPSPKAGAWGRANGLILRNPRSPLFKEFARTDRHNSMGRRGFDLLVVMSTVLPRHRTHHRWTISTQPDSGFHLLGLGGLLERLEESREARHGSLLSGRERVAPGTGRHGYNVASPWYDGRGHRFTIVDSPVVDLKGRRVMASCLTEQDIVDGLKRYGADAEAAKADRDLPV